MASDGYNEELALDDADDLESLKSSAKKE